LNGAGYDLTTFSAEITHMNQHATDVAAHVIVGDFTLSGNLTDLPNPLGGFYKALNKYAALELADTYFQPIPDSDLVVSADSQEAGLFGQNSCSVFNHQHIGAANVTNVLLKCLSLYLKPPSHNWYSKGFPTGWSATPQPPAPPPANSPATYQNSSLLLLASGSNATAGFTASLSVSEPAGTNFSSVLLLASGSAVEDTNAPFDFTVTIPWEAIGNYPVSYLAVD